MASADSPQKPTAGESAPRTRHVSPSYPFLSLGEAIEKAEILYKHDKRNVFSWDVAVTHWGYKLTTSNGRLSVAALKKFGLLEDVGGGKSGQHRLSRLALDIILLNDQEHAEERRKAIQGAALRPTLHAELWDRWGPDLPSDATMRATLIREWDFNDSYVAGFIRNYRRTLEFAKLTGPDALVNSDANGTMVEDAEDSAPLREPIADMTPRAPTPVNAMIPPATPTQISRPAEFPPVAASEAVRVRSLPIDEDRSFDFRYPADLSAEDIDYLVGFLNHWKTRLPSKSAATNGPTDPA
jgi:hypothetical protein